MKQLVLVAMLAALASSALTLLGVHALSPVGMEARRAGPPPGGQVDLADVVKELAALRRDLGEALRAAPSQALSGTAPGIGSPPTVGRTAAAPSDAGGSPPSEVVPAATRYTRMAETIVPDSEREGRQQVGKGPRAVWMLRSEREVLDWFGPPDAVQVDEKGIESWRYYTPKESGIVGMGFLTFEIHEGRVIDFN